MAASYNVTTSNGNFVAQRELDPMGANVGLNDPLQAPPAPAPGEVAFLAAGDGFFPDGKCSIDGLVVGCSSVSILLYSGFGSPGSVETPGSSWAGLSLVDRPKPGDWCSTRKDGKIDGIIGPDGKCRKALSGDNSVTIGLGDSRFRIFYMLGPPKYLFTGKIDSFTPRGDFNLDDLQRTLDYIGLCPGYGAWADGANAIIYTGKGEFGNAAISGIAVIPVAEWFANAFKWGNRASGLGDLTKAEVKEIQKIVDEAGRPLEVVGSAARGERRGIGTNLPIGKPPGTRSDIDYAISHSSIEHFEKTDLYLKLPSIGSHGIVGGGHNPFMGPGIRFEPGAKPCFIPAKK
jgi:hypothetical protein